MISVQAELDYVDGIARWLLELAATCVERSALDDAMQYCHLAATILCRQNRTLVSVRLEEILREIAAEVQPTAPRAVNESASTLHVMSDALQAGGVTAMATRWMVNDGHARRHDVALLGQQASVPEALVAACRRTGGQVHVASATYSFLERALWLRRLAHEYASLVVLHVDVSDVIAGVAFGVSGGPPVTLVNHTAHLYWTGSGVVDMLLNCRGSALEGVWAERFRGLRRHATVPIPLDPPPTNPVFARAGTHRCHMRQRLGIAPDAVVLLTVGAAFKYLRYGNLDFVATCERVLAQQPGTVLVAAGFPPDERWEAASARVSGRILTPGRLTESELADLYAASDIYLDGFPFGTTTALLEASLYGLAVVLSPRECPPPFGTDGIATDEVLERPASVREYAHAVEALIASPAKRRHLGELVRDSVARHHTCAGWHAHLAAALAALPREHELSSLLRPERTPPAIHEYWFPFQKRWTVAAHETFENVLAQAYAIGLRPYVSPELLTAFEQGKTIRREGTIPMPIVRVLCSLLQRVPPRAACTTVRTAAFVFRGQLIRRSVQKLCRTSADNLAEPAPYSEYRDSSVQRAHTRPSMRSHECSQEPERPMPVDPVASSNSSKACPDQPRSQSIDRGPDASRRGH